MRVGEGDILGCLGASLWVLKHHVPRYREQDRQLPVVDGASERPQRPFDRNTFVLASTGEQIAVIWADGTG
jgi:hypothetical protein